MASIRSPVVVGVRDDLFQKEEESNDLGTTTRLGK